MSVQNKFVETDFIKKVNKIAENAYYYKANNDIRYKTEQNKLAAMIIDKIKIIAKTNTKIKDDSDYLSEACQLFTESLKSWEPGKAGFWAYFKSILDKREKGLYYSKFDDYQCSAYKELKKRSASLSDEEKEKLKLTAQRLDLYAGEDDDNPSQEIPDKSNAENDAMESEIMKIHFDFLNTIIMGQKKKYQNSVKPCYPAYFYTEFVTKMINDVGNNAVFSDAEKGLMKIVEHDFISYYMIGDNSTVSGISCGRLKKTGDFSDDPNDNRPCGYELKNIVYAKFISQLKNSDKLQSDSSISQQRSKFMQLMQSAMGKNIINE